jgi:hypothetical protein
MYGIVITISCYSFKTPYRFSDSNLVTLITIVSM